ncbi:hypothetical protein J2858_002115 [Neorhizobium galegae]|uniref:CrpP-related protein n=1 Tax=Rhizobium/Agrobacterium group TaxID=227290 RepID=UPI001AE4A905|nr:CrpP-related protein [Neorhizobium galegae]MBP2549192.1 hypothetical protein [Neorhizobium galegae]
MNIESLLEWQERGSKARMLGATAQENPFLRPMVHDGLGREDVQLMCDAWAFGWAIEHAMRRIDTGFYSAFLEERSLDHSRVA